MSNKVLAGAMSSHTSGLSPPVQSAKISWDGTAKSSPEFEPAKEATWIELSESRLLLASNKVVSSGDSPSPSILPNVLGSNVTGVFDASSEKLGFSTANIVSDSSVKTIEMKRTVE